MAGVSADLERVPASDRLRMFERVRETVRATPGVADAAFSFLTPVSGPILLRPIASDVGSRGGAERLASVNLVSPGWFRTLGTPIVAGREFTDADHGGAQPVVVVNEAFVRTFMKAARPLGQIVSIGIIGPNVGAAEVVGIAGDAVYASLREPPPPTIFFPLAQLRIAPPASLTLTVRAQAGSPLALTGSIAAAVATVNPDAVLSFRPLTEQITAARAQERVLALLSGGLGAIAVLLAGLGLFGVTAHAVARRLREIGIRMALGARPRDVVGRVLGRVLVMTGMGVAPGVLVSFWSAPLIASLLFGLEPRDPLTVAAAAAVLVAAGVLAALPSAWRAARVDPAIVLRAE
jgi:hypothetical protein